MKSIIYKSALCILAISFFAGSGADAQNIHTAFLDANPTYIADNTGYKYESLGENEDGTFTGKITKYFDEGSISEVGQYVRDQKHGIWTEYNKSGKKISHAQFKNGLKHGEWFVWGENGQLLYHMLYKEGQRVGTWKIYNDDGTIREERSY